MRLILKDKKSGSIKSRVKYPSANLSDIIRDMDPDLQYYELEEDPTPEFDPLTHFPNYGEIVLTEETTGNPNFLKATRPVTIEQLSDEDILENLKSAYLSDKAEKWPKATEERDYSRRILILALKADGLPYDKEEESYHWRVGNWEISRREEYQSQKTAFINGGVLPSFTFPEFPV